jgi:hypothetical protein
LPPGFPTILKNPSMKVVEKGRNAILVKRPKKIFFFIVTDAAEKVS